VTDDAKQKRSREAIHWRKPWTMPGARRPSWEVACGWKLDAANLQERTTHDREQVTCLACRDALAGEGK
jgi:hypothetical protein